MIKIHSYSLPLFPVALNFIAVLPGSRSLMIEQENKEKEKEKDRQFSGVIGEPETSKVLSHFCDHTFF